MPNICSLLITTYIWHKYTYVRLTIYRIKQTTLNPKNVTHNELKALFHSNNTLHPVHIKLDGVQEPARRERKGLTYHPHRGLRE
ncbi:hypothetical protein PC1C4_20600 [Paraprevotella clara]|nr:hypothetical protein PC1C4_20600 [Paraprevotella clara]